MTPLFLFFVFCFFVFLIKIMIKLQTYYMPEMTKIMHLREYKFIVDLLIILSHVCIYNNI